MTKMIEFNYTQPDDLEKAFADLFNLVYTMRRNHIRNAPQVLQRVDQHKADAYLNRLIQQDSFKLKSK